MHIVLYMVLKYHVSIFLDEDALVRSKETPWR